MKKVTAYQTEDGKTFNNECDAATHELRLNIRGIVERFRFANRSPSEAELDEISENIVNESFYINRMISKALPYMPVQAEEDDS